MRMPSTLELLELFKTNAYRIPYEFLKVILPRRVVDHHIELEFGDLPLTQVPYRLLGLELNDLRHQLRELVDVKSFFHSHFPHGAPVLFKKNKDKNEMRICIDYQALRKYAMNN